MLKGIFLLSQVHQMLTSTCCSLLTPIEKAKEEDPKKPRVLRTSLESKLNTRPLLRFSRWTLTWCVPGPNHITPIIPLNKVMLFGTSELNLWFLL